MGVNEIIGQGSQATEVYQGRLAAALGRKQFMESQVLPVKFDIENEQGPIIDALREAGVPIVTVRVRRRGDGYYKDIIAGASPWVIFDKTTEKGAPMTGSEYLRDDPNGPEGPWWTIFTQVVTTPDHPVGQGGPHTLSKRRPRNKKSRGI